MRTQTITFEQWRREAPQQRAKIAPLLARLGPIVRDKPRDPTEPSTCAASARPSGSSARTPEHPPPARRGRSATRSVGGHVGGTRPATAS